MFIPDIVITSNSHSGNIYMYSWAGAPNRGVGGGGGCNPPEFWRWGGGGVGYLSNPLILKKFFFIVYSPVSSCYDILKSSNSHHFVVPSHVMKVKHSRTNIPFVSILGHFSLWFALSALVFYVVFLKILKHRSGSSVKIKICGLEHF